MQEEAQIIRNAASVLLPDGRGMDAVERFLDAGAHADAVIAILRQSLPQLGFRIVMPPPVPHEVRPRAAACVWRAGDARASSSHATTPALALLRAIQSEWADQQDEQLYRTCTQCNGIGWYLAVNGGKQMCRHVHN